MGSGYADIIIDISHEKVDRPFQYRVPERMAGDISVGMRVRVPFGKGDAVRTGYVVGLSDTPQFDPARIKEIEGLVKESTSVQSQLISLAWWMRETYGATMNQALKTVLPVRQKVKAREKRTILCRMGREELERERAEASRKHFRARARLLEAFLENPVIPMEVARDQLSLSSSTLNPLVERGQIEIVAEKVNREAFRAPEGVSEGLLLNEEQSRAVRQVLTDYRQGICRTYLLYGITGSGKTEVYMELIAQVLADGKQAILLIPEIALTYQTVMRFYRRFGDRIAIMNSRLSAGERYDQWERAARGEVSLMIGPRSALFTPFPDLGLIIMDEEHEGAYKSETMPRYHAREVAEKRAAMAGASLILGSATPSLEAYSKAMAGTYTLLTLQHRAAAGSVLPSVHVEDMRAELSEGNKSVFSRRLDQLLVDRLERGEQAMLFINRRGYSNFVSCRSCGEAVRCPHCDVSLTLHGRDQLVCHYCGYRIPLMKRCPACGSPYLAGFGAGTQRMEELTRERFPEARILRMDADTTARKGSHEEILAAFAAHEADILIGTQMIVKGHDFPKVTLVGILAADLSLNTPDYRSGERTFQLLTQAAGRAGRSCRPGDVVIQTYQPEHYAVTAAAAQDYGAFYRQEMAYRSLMGYPPVRYMAMVLLSSPGEKSLNQCAALCREEIGRLFAESFAEEKKRERVPELIGPVPAPVYKVNDIYRKILYIKCEKYDILVQIRGRLDALAAGEECFRSVLIQYDIS